MSHSFVTVTEKTWYGGKFLGGSQRETAPNPVTTDYHSLRITHQVIPMPCDACTSYM